MGIEILIQKYGYAAILFGTFLEGETILILGGFAAHRGYLSLPFVILCAFTGSFFGDQLYFFIGKNKGAKFLERRPSLKRKGLRFQLLLQRHYVAVILLFRFIYGLRTVAPLVIGMSGISFTRFFLFNLMSALLWAVIIGTGGYYFGNTMELVLDDVKKYEGAVIMIGAAIVVLRILTVFLKNRKKRADGNTRDSRTLS